MGDVERGKGDFIFSAASIRIRNENNYKIIPLGSYFTTEK
jgi:hypothetical protein